MFTLRALILVPAFTIFFFISYAQTDSDCEQTLSQAALEFEAGHFYGLPALLKPCLSKFTKEQSIRAYLLLAQAYLIIDDPIGAEDSYLKLLKANPEYVASPEKDPIDIVYLSKKFTTRPIFIPRFRAGFNFSRARTISELTTDPLPVGVKQKFGFGLNVGAGMDVNVSDHWAVGFDFLLSTKSFETSKTSISLFDSQSIAESQYGLDIPIYAKYSREFNKFRPYVYAGLGFHNLLGSTIDATYVNNNEAGDQSVTVVGSIPTLYKRNTLNKSIFIGFGSRYKISKNFISIDFRYMAGLSNFTKINANYYGNGTSDVANSITQYRLIGDLFRLDNISFSVEYSYPLYNPRRIKPIKSGRFFNNMLKRKTPNKNEILK